MAAAATTALTGGGFVDADHATHPLDVLEIVDGFLLVSVGRHLHEGETTLAAGFPVEREAALGHLAVLAEQIQQILLFGLEREVAYVNGHSFNGTLKTDSWMLRVPSGASKRWNQPHPTGRRSPHRCRAALLARQRGGDEEA